MQASVTFSAAELMAGTKKVIVPAPGVGKMVVPLSWACTLPADYVYSPSSIVKAINYGYDAAFAITMVTTGQNIPSSGSQYLKASTQVTNPPQISQLVNNGVDFTNLSLSVAAATGVVNQLKGLTVICVYAVV